METLRSPERVARTRIAESRAEIRNSLKMMAIGNPFAAEPDPARRRERVQAKANFSAAEARAFDADVRRRQEEGGAALEGLGPRLERVVDTASRPFPADRMSGAEAVWGDTIDFVDVAFLAKGARVARSVGRVTFANNGRGNGSGVLIGAGLFLTNNHVVFSANHARQFILEFDYERDESGVRRAETRFAVDPSVFVHDIVEGLDFSIFAVGDKITGPSELAEMGTSPLSDAPDKHMLGEFANIVQHPRGRLKEVVLRENRLVSRFDDFLHYVADTEKGSSGSPVYNSEWQIIALHHWGGPYGEPGDPLLPGSIEVNEGIRISSIVRHLRKNLNTYPPDVQTRLTEVLGGAMSEAAMPIANVSTRGESPAPGVRVDAAGRATWIVPVEISVRLPVTGDAPHVPAAPLPAAPERAVQPAADTYADRKGYLPHFLKGFQVPLPRLGPSIADDAAPLLDPEPGENPFELKYHHFSVIMNRKRRLAFVTACMIDGASAKSIGRGSRRVTDLSADDTGLAESVGALDAAEADSWAADPRILREHQSGNELYRKQGIPGHPDPRDSGRIARMFQKGHLVRRLDPAWGLEDGALMAEIDTFHWTNAVPQVGFFNQGTADEDLPGTSRGNLWRAAENYVLRNAVAMDQRVVSFTGPIFSEDDRKFRHTRVPGRFFKVTVWVEEGVLKSLALIVDQMQVIEVWPESLGNAERSQAFDQSEAFQDADEMERVADFLSTVDEVEQLTDLDFGDAVRLADIRLDQPGRRVESMEDLPLSGTENRSASGANPGDNLKEIKGIGSKTETALNRNGVYRFNQIASWSVEEANQVSVRIGYPGRASREDWIAQAQRLKARTDIDR